MYVASHHSIDELKLLIKQYHCSNIRQRLQIILLGKEGKPYSTPSILDVVKYIFLSINYAKISETL